MIFHTKCPHCQTVFRVTEDQLKLYDGTVRCGVCQQVFNASDHIEKSAGSQGEKQESSAHNVQHPIPTLDDSTLVADLQGSRRPQVKVEPPSPQNLPSIGAAATQKSQEQPQAPVPPPARPAAPPKLAVRKPSPPAEAPLPDTPDKADDDITISLTDEAIAGGTSQSNLLFDKLEEEISSITQELDQVSEKLLGSSLDVPQDFADEAVAEAEAAPVNVPPSVPQTPAPPAAAPAVFRTSSPANVEPQRPDEPERVTIPVPDEPPSFLRIPQPSQPSQPHLAPQPHLTPQAAPPAPQPHMTPQAVPPAPPPHLTPQAPQAPQQPLAPPPLTVTSQPPPAPSVQMIPDEAPVPEQKDPWALPAFPPRYFDTDPLPAGRSSPGLPDPGGDAYDTTAQKKSNLLGRRPIKKGLLSGRMRSLITLALLVFFVVQVLYVYHDRLITWVPVSETLVTKACDLFSCPRNLKSTISDLSIEANELQSVAPQTDMYLLTMMVKNNSSSRMSWPHVELTLLDSDKSTLSRRVFSPANYLTDSDLVSKGIPPYYVNPVRLYIETIIPPDADYRITLFYP